MKAVFFDVGETLVDEERWWRALAERSGLQPHVVWAALGVTIERGEEHDALWRHLGIERPADWWDELTYERRRLSIRTRCRVSRRFAPAVCVSGSSEIRRRRSSAGRARSGCRRTSSRRRPALGVRKPDPRFFECLVELAECAPDELVYVGDRVDNDVLPALAAGLVAVHLRRGPWGRLQSAPRRASQRLPGSMSFRTR